MRCEANASPRSVSAISRRSTHARFTTYVHVVILLRAELAYETVRCATFWILELAPIQVKRTGQPPDNYPVIGDANRVWRAIDSPFLIDCSAAFITSSTWSA